MTRKKIVRYDEMNLKEYNGDQPRYCYQRTVHIEMIWKIASEGNKIFKLHPFTCPPEFTFRKTQKMRKQIEEIMEALK